MEQGSREERRRGRKAREREGENGIEKWETEGYPCCDKTDMTNFSYLNINKKRLKTSETTLSQRIHHPDEHIRALVPATNQKKHTHRGPSTGARLKVT